MTTSAAAPPPSTPALYRGNNVAMPWWIFLVLLLIAAGVFTTLQLTGVMSLPFSGWILLTARIVIVFLFIAFGWREILALFQRPAKNMGTGLSRVWAVARTTLLEAWAGRIWLLPILWLICSIILINVVKPFDESERMALDIRMLLAAQELLLLVMLWVMACVSLPRERERKIIISNASKPLSRLEIILGKMTGFSVVAALMLVVLGLGSWVLLRIEDYRIRNQAGDAYQLQKADFDKKTL